MPRVRVGLAQMNVTVGALEANAAAIAAALHRAEDAGCDVLVTPELALTGYPPEDLLKKEGFLIRTRDALDALAALTGDTALVVGTPLSRGAPGVSLEPITDARSWAGEGQGGRADEVANALVVAHGGRWVASATKRLLPNYDVFDEDRYFRRGEGPLTLVQVAGAAVGLLICEDVWTADGPASELAARGASLLLVANASPFARGRQGDRERMVRERARETSCAVAYVNMVGGQDELVFDGRSFVVDAGGAVVARASAFDEELLVVDLDLADGRAPVSVARSARTKPPHQNIVAAPLGPLAEVYDALVTGTRDYLAKNGFADAVLGVSGGVDSALVATVAADALGPEHVKTYALPSRFSSEGSLLDAKELTARLGIELTVLPIEGVHRALAATLAPALGTEPIGLTDENLQSRIRAALWMAISNATGAIVLTTGNKSELATGYFTLYGDSAGGFAVIKDVPKTLVYELCRWRNERAVATGAPPPIPEEILTKAPSAELRPDQRDDQSLPPYELLDPLLERYVEGDATAEELISEGHDPDLVARVARLVDLSEYKRRQMPPGVRVTRKAFGRDRRMPITNGFKIPPASP